MSAIVTNDLSPGTGNIGLILHHDIDNLPSFCTDSNPQTVISITTDGLYEFLTFQALLFWDLEFFVFHRLNYFYPILVV